MTILLTLLATYLFVCLILFVFQSRFVFFPDRALVATPQSAGLDYQDVFFKTEDGVMLHGWHVPAPGARDVLLFFHGNAGNVSHRLDSIRIFHTLGFSVFIIDYRGYGKSAGRMGEAGSYKDARAALRYVTGDLGVGLDHIIYFGR
ncbi:MAG: alpha/beta hydrolase, partial [Candidatus Krumholzibacteria bacterium]|nr:alpha/beta hydrolase [Candidatus Krumholzibacteria bacterium]